MTSIDNSPEAISQQLIDIVHILMKSSQGPVFELSGKYDLTLSQLKILMILGNSERPLALHEIAEATVLSLPAAGRAVDALLQHDLVTRREDELDRRVKRVALTEKGSEATGRVADARLAAVQDAVNELSGDERTALAEALGPLAQYIPGPGSKHAGQEPEMEVSR